MSEITEWHSNATIQKPKAVWWKNKPTDDLFLDIDIAVPEGFEVVQRKTLSYIEFHPKDTPNTVRVRLYAKPSQSVVPSSSSVGAKTANSIVKPSQTNADEKTEA